MINTAVDPVVRDVQERLLPMLAQLDRILESGGDDRARAFFKRISDATVHAQIADDLMTPFMQLATSAFQGFEFEFSLSLLLDEILAAAETFSWTLAADETISH